MLNELYSTFFVVKLDFSFFEWAASVVLVMVLSTILKNFLINMNCKKSLKEESFCCSRKDKIVDV